VEGFFVIVRSNAEFFARPQVYFSRPELEFYLGLMASTRGGWNATTLGARIEAFAIAGCDVAGTF
jgi:hypothetical protein